MAAAVVEVPAILDVVGPSMPGSWRGQSLGACTDCRRLWAEHRAGRLTDADIREAEGTLFNTAGTCTVMGTASTMALMAETLGMALPGAASPPAPTGARLRHGAQTGRAAVRLARERTLAREILSRPAFENAIRALCAVGGSTNAVIHLLAVARRLGVDLALDDFDRIARETPLLADVKPTGNLYMDDFHAAGGAPALLKALEPMLDLGHRGVAGRTLGDRLDDVGPRAVGPAISTPDDPTGPPGALAVLRGSLAPDGAIIKAAAASPELLVHEGPAVVFESPQDAARRIDDPALGLTADHVLVLRNAGPVAAAMPGAGSMKIPKPLAERA